MICHIDGEPMKTVPGSETGFIKPRHYVTQETKECPVCGLRVVERYEAKAEETEIQTKE